MDESNVRTVFGPTYDPSLYRVVALVGVVAFVVAVVLANVTGGVVRGVLVIVGLIMAFASLAGAKNWRAPYHLAFDSAGFEVRPPNRFRSIRIPWSDIAAWDIRALGGQTAGNIVLAWPAEHVRSPAEGPGSALWNRRANAWLMCEIAQCDATEDDIAKAIAAVAPQLPRGTRM